MRFRSSDALDVQRTLGFAVAVLSFGSEHALGQTIPSFADPSEMLIGVIRGGTPQPAMARQAFQGDESRRVDSFIAQIVRPSKTC